MRPNELRKQHCHDKRSAIKMSKRIRNDNFVVSVTLFHLVAVLRSTPFSGGARTQGPQCLHVEIFKADQ